jgi:hypothetical protein
MPFGDNPDSQDNEWTKLFEHGLRPLESEITGLPEGIDHIPVKLWRADRNLESLALKTNVLKGLESCDFLLAVLTTSVVRGTHGLRLTNPNVLWEMGYAEAIGKQIVVLADSHDLRRLPVLAGVPNVCVYNHKLVQQVSAKDAPSALTFIAKNLVQHIAKARDESQRGPTTLAGSRTRFYPSRDSVDLPDLISKARKQVDILTTNMQFFLSSPFDTEPHPLAKALNNGATVRVVTMDPESVIAEYRAKQLVRGQDVPGYRRELRNGIIEFFNRYGEHPDFHIHIYNDLPLQITTRVDNTIVTSVVTIGERARKRIQIRFALHDEGVPESFVGHFQSMFDSSNDVAGLKWVVRPGAEDRTEDREAAEVKKMAAHGGRA